MSENNFHTPPLPPKAPSIGTQPVFPEKQKSERIPETDVKSAFQMVFQNKMLMILFVGVACIGLLLGALFFGGSTPQQKVSGLSARIATNPDLKVKLPICGTVGPTYSCVMFIFNHSQNDKRAEEFFKDAEKLSGRSEFLIKIANKEYTQKRIPRGWIAQIIIPPIR